MIGRQRRPTLLEGALSGLLVLAGCSSETELESQAKDSGAPDAEVTIDAEPPSNGSSCETVRREVLGQVDAVSQGDVVIVGEQAGVRVLYVDASAGGFQLAAENPYTYVNLKSGAKVDVTDFEADESRKWDLAFKRFTIRTNSGDSGPGEGGAVGLDGAFALVRASNFDHDGIAVDEFLDDETCEGKPGSANGEGVLTQFSGWYEYDESTMVLSPYPATFVVRSADGKTLFKIEILDYYGTPTGQRGRVSGRFLMRYAQL